MMTNPKSKGSNESAASTANMASIESKARSAVSRVLTADLYRMQCLTALKALNLPQGYLAAGFLRNAIWDELHGYKKATPLNDIDVIYFNPSDTSKDTELNIEKALTSQVPSAHWQVKNQARMHLNHGHNAYRDCEEAISYWVEKETCVAIRLCPKEGSDKFDMLAPYGLSSNFAGRISINPRHPRDDVFTQRVKTKNWLVTWPQLTLGSALVRSI
ncbi:nucleotidyltransferase family protein [Alteromonas sp. CI.11.F.A3]|uniref:nucleotidyltransferase family protein n=1 Tax=Alteromonas sp. CI.11.F.A3 TaxID=3079555 RepID=UPI0029437727|nr:nucleotidyltransferase family protein [Alteromonas sp. CI.11.F.A3]WOI36982.1 nucleotidyltransferase family protein [Alteromonas sp. CI.11.F.A3]